jgi:hypothetical protein
MRKPSKPSPDKGKGKPKAKATDSKHKRAFEGLLDLAVKDKKGEN